MSADSVQWKKSTIKLHDDLFLAQEHFKNNNENQRLSKHGYLPSS